MTRLRKYGFFTFGQVVPGLQLQGAPVQYPVLNERAIRAGAGIVFAAGFFAFFHALYLQNFLYIQVLVLLLLCDFFIKVVVGTRFSPISQLATMIVRGQKPEFVPAAPKRFAWGIGLVLATTMTILLFGFGVTGLPNVLVCSVCLTVLFFESAFGICIGCKIYAALAALGMTKAS